MCRQQCVANNVSSFARALNYYYFRLVTARKIRGSLSPEMKDTDRPTITWYFWTQEIKLVELKYSLYLIEFGLKKFMVWLDLIAYASVELFVIG